MQDTQQSKWSTPTEVNDLDIAFPATVRHLMPKYSEVPEEFQGNSSKWNRFFSDMFYRGIKNADLKPKEGIDKDKAMRHIRCVAGSFEPKHEHKEAAVAYLMSLWFDDSSTWERAK